MKKIALSLAVIFSFGIYAFFLKTGEQDASSTAATEPAPAESAGNTAADGGISPSPNTYKDGTFTGKSIDVFYGNVRVSATLKSDRITDIVFLEYPNDNPTSLGKSNGAMPLLKQEAIANQSADVHIVSGATETSSGFMDSLESAMDQAKI
ncbi:MAG: FMN-binding protein [bacterium]